MATKRIIDQPTDTALSPGDLIIVDSEESGVGTRKFDLGTELTDIKQDLAELEGGGLTEDAKQALLACFQNVAWIGEDGQDYYDALESALYPSADLVSISAVFTQGQNVIYDTDDLDTLKQYLVVTAHYSDSSTATVTTYALSGSLTVGTSTITVTYGGKTTTFNVTVTHELTYVQDGLVMWLDGEKNSTGGTHATSLSTWVDQSGNGWDWTNDGNATINSKSVGFNGSSTTFSRNSIPQNVQMIEVVLNNTSNGCVMTGFGRNYIGNVNIRSSDSLIAFHTATGSGENTNTGFIFGTGLHSANSGGYLDGEPATLISTSADWQGTNPKLGVYRYSNSNSYYFSGEIYCIRLYNRILTEEEILFNFATDQERFGIGVGS